MGEITEQKKTHVISEKVEVILKKIHDNMKPDMDENAQSELSELVTILTTLKNDTLVDQVIVGIEALLVKPPNIKLASTIREKLQRETPCIKKIIKFFFREKSTPTYVIMGLGTLCYITIPVILVILPKNFTETKIVGIPADMLFGVAIAGAVGSIVSIMVRIQDFSVIDKVDPTISFFTGFFKPVVGMAFALFVFAVIKAKLIPLQIGEGLEHYFFLAVAFITGFSERFAHDIVITTERQIGGKKPDKTPDA